MVVVYKSGCIPISYSASICSCATLVTIVVYASALIFPFLINGWAKDFFPLTRVAYEQPTLSTNSEIKVIIPDLDYTFAIPTSAADPKYQYVPAAYERSISEDKTSIDFTLTFSTENVGASSVYIEFPYVVNFSKTLGTAFDGIMKLNLNSYEKACSVAVHGSLGFNQQKAYTSSHLPSPEGYEKYADEHNIPVTESDPRIYGEPYFKEKSVDFVIGESNTYEIKFQMHAPLLQVIMKENFWYSLLAGWTSYVAIAIPFFFFARKILNFLFGSGIITVYPTVDAVVAKEGIPKFNR